MSKGAASEEKLGKLHDAVADVLTSALDVVKTQHEQYMQSGNQEEELPPEVPASLLAVAVNFLKSNGVTMSVAGNEALSKTQRAVEEARKRRAGNVVRLADVAVNE